MRINKFMEQVSPDEPVKIRPHVKDDVLHFNSFVEEWDEIATVVSAWIDVDPLVRLSYVRQHAGYILSLAYNTKLCDPRPEYNILVGKGIVWDEGELAVRSLLFMPNKHDGMFQDPRFDRSQMAFVAADNQDILDIGIIDMAFTLLRAKEADVYYFDHRLTNYAEEIPATYYDRVKDKDIISLEDFCDYDFYRTDREALLELDSDAVSLLLPKGTWYKEYRAVVEFQRRHLLGDSNWAVEYKAWFGIADYNKLIERGSKMKVRISK